MQSEHPSDEFKHTVPKSEAEHIYSWAEHFEAGDTIKWTTGDVDGVQESTVIGFSTDQVAKPVIEAPDCLDLHESTQTVKIPEGVWVPDDADAVARIELEYTKRITAKVPVNELPDGEAAAIHLVGEDASHEIPDALPNSWDEILEKGELSVVEISEEEP